MFNEILKKAQPIGMKAIWFLIAFIFGAILYWSAHFLKVAFHQIDGELIVFYVPAVWGLFAGIMVFLLERFETKNFLFWICLILFTSAGPMVWLGVVWLKMFFCFLLSIIFWWLILKLVFRKY